MPVNIKGMSYHLTNYLSTSTSITRQGECDKSSNINDDALIKIQDEEFGKRLSAIKREVKDVFNKLEEANKVKSKSKFHTFRIIIEQSNGEINLIDNMNFYLENNVNSTKYKSFVDILKLLMSDSESIIGGFYSLQEKKINEGICYELVPYEKQNIAIPPTDPSFSSIRSVHPPRNTHEYKNQEVIKYNEDINLLRDDIYSLYYNECKLIFEYYLNDKLLSMLNNSPCMGIEELRMKMHGAKSEYNKIKECDSYDKLKEHKSLSERRNNKLGSYVLMNEQVLITSILKVELELNIKVENSTVDMESVPRGMETIVQLIEFNDKKKNILVRILSALASHIFPLTHSKREKEKEAYIVELKELAYMIMGLNDGNRDILTKRELFNKAVYCSLLKNIPAKYSFDPLGILSPDRTAWLKLLNLNGGGPAK